MDSKKITYTKIFFGSDHAGYGLKNELYKYLKDDKKLENCVDLGCYSFQMVDYPDFGFQVAKEAATNPNHLGILVCGSGIGISMTANKVKGVRCGICHDYNTALYSKQKLNCNVVAMGDRVIGLEVAKQIVDVFLYTPFQDTPENQKIIQKIKELEEKNLCI